MTQPARAGRDAPTASPESGKSWTSRQRAAFAGLAALALGLSLAAFHARWRALAFSGHDLAYYAAQYRRLLDSPAWTGLPFHSSGRNLFGFAGPDGLPTLHHDVHASPLKYLLALAYRLTGSLLVVQGAFTVSYLGAMGYALRRLVGREYAALALGALALVTLSPWFLEAACFDLRSYVLLGPAVLLLASALASRAPATHLGAIALFGLGAREEAALLLVIAVLHLELDGRRREARALYALCVSYAVAFHVFYALVLGFPYGPGAVAVVASSALLLPPALWLAPAGARAWLDARFTPVRRAALLSLAAPFLALSVGNPLGGRIDHQLWDRIFPALVVVVVVLVDWLVAQPSATLRRGVARGLALAAVLALAGSASSILAWREEGARRADFWRALERLPDATVIVTDYDHAAPLVGRDGVLVWERGPEVPSSPGGRRSLAARERVLRQLREGDTIVIARDGPFAAIAASLEASGDRGVISECLRTEWLVLARTGAAECPEPLTRP